VHCLPRPREQQQAGITGTGQLRLASSQSGRSLGTGQSRPSHLRAHHPLPPPCVQENNIPVIVFDIMTENNILHAALGKPVGTVVCESDELAASMDFMD
jgi:hypothetical protein